MGNNILHYLLGDKVCRLPDKGEKSFIKKRCIEWMDRETGFGDGREGSAQRFGWLATGGAASPD
jgi:hypothetical protein